MSKGSKYTRGSTVIWSFNNNLEFQAASGGTKIDLKFHEPLQGSDIILSCAHYLWLALWAMNGTTRAQNLREFFS